MIFLVYILVKIFSILLQTVNACSSSSSPVITSWLRCNGTGYNGITSNVRIVQYSSNNVYVTASCIPSYTIGPWNNSNTPKDLNITFKYPLTPKVSTGKKMANGHVGQWINGVPIFSSNDGLSYNSLGYWTQNAYFWEAGLLDNCNGHVDSNSEYHHHVNPKCLYTIDPTQHSPILGYAFDGFPIYGPYGYRTANDSSSRPTRMKTSYRLRNITVRNSYANGTLLSGTATGPSISTQYPLGAYLEDYEFVSGYGNLDEYNGRYGKTPERPEGTYAYFVTIDGNGDPEYPYTIGSNYNGIPSTFNITNSNGQINIITEATTIYFSCNANKMKFHFSMLLALISIGLFINMK